MEPEDSGSTTVALQVKRVSFLDDSVKLKVLSRELSKSSKDAIDVLVEMLGSPDMRLRFQAATKLLEFDIDVKKAISSDQIQRVIAEIKLNGAGGSKSLELEDNKPKRPLVDFGTIRQIS